MKTVLLTGANGFLGQHLASTLMSRCKVVATGKGPSRLHTPGIQYYELDITDVNAVNTFFEKHSPDIVIHNAAMSKPDECDSNREACVRINVDATANLLRMFVPHFIYISTDFVFGEGGPHAENENPNPLNFYGHSKLLAEQAVANSGMAHTIVRPAFIYGKIWPGMRPTFVQWVKQSLEQKKTIKVVSDQWRTPTYVQDICQGILSIINLNAFGIFHLAGSEIVSPYQMAIQVANHLQLNSSLIQNVTSNDFVEPVQRAKRSGLKVDKAVHLLDYKPIAIADGLQLAF